VTAPASGLLVGFVHASRGWPIVGVLSIVNRDFLTHQLDCPAGIIHLSDLRFFVFHGYHLLSMLELPSWENSLSRLRAS
jgi:hypothetical protein